MGKPEVWGFGCNRREEDFVWWRVEVKMQGEGLEFVLGSVEGGACGGWMEQMFEVGWKRIENDAEGWTT